MRAAHKITDIVMLGIRSLTLHIVRSILTAMGIFFGVWSVIAMLAINEGASWESQQALRKMGSDNLLIKSIKPPQESATDGRPSALNYGLTDQDVRRLADLPGVGRMVTAHRTLKHAMRGTKRIAVEILGTHPSYIDLARLKLTKGDFLKPINLIRTHNVCVITESLARKLFAYENPIGQTLRVGNECFRVKGVVVESAEGMRSGQEEIARYVIYMPATTEKKRFGTQTFISVGGQWQAEMVEVSQIILQMSDEQAVLSGANIARSLLARTHTKSEDYEIIVPLELIEQRKKQRRLWNIMFFAIASISLLVGGIGIMNIMLASVTERTREIGVRRALGAKRRDITIQFLVESVTLTTVGGILGIVLGMLVPLVVEKVLDLKTIVSAEALIIPFAMAITVGLASGLYPAIRAARLDPIEALRHE